MAPAWSLTPQRPPPASQRGETLFFFLLLKSTQKRAILQKIVKCGEIGVTVIMTRRCFTQDVNKEVQTLSHWTHGDPEISKCGRHTLPPSTMAVPSTLSSLIVQESKILSTL